MTEFNHLPPSTKESREKWDRRFLEQAKLIASYSKDRTKVGAVVVNDLRQIVGSGYNGFPRGVNDTEDRINNRPTKYLFTVHAEINACILAGNQARGSTLYVYPSFMSPPICPACCKEVAQFGIRRIVGFKPQSVSNTWQETGWVSQAICDEVGIEITLLEEN